VEYVQRQRKGRKRNSGNSIAEVKGNYKKVNVEEKSAWGLYKKICLNYFLQTGIDPEANSIGISIARRLPVYNENVRPKIAPVSIQTGVKSLVLRLQISKIIFVSCNDNRTK
jgi:hypothetical protein